MIGEHLSWSQVSLVGLGVIMAGTFLKLGISKLIQARKPTGASVVREQKRQRRRRDDLRNSLMLCWIDFLNQEGIDRDMSVNEAQSSSLLTPAQRYVARRFLQLWECL